MADKFRVALSSDFKKSDGSPTFPDFDLEPLKSAPGIEMAFLDPTNPMVAGIAYACISRRERRPR